jgi:hypothetical protein
MSGECKHHQTSIWMDLSHEALQFLVSSRCYGSAHRGGADHQITRPMRMCMISCGALSLTSRIKGTQIKLAIQTMTCLQPGFGLRMSTLLTVIGAILHATDSNPLAFQASLKNWAESNSSSQQSYSSFDLIPFILKDGTEFCRN